MTSFATSVTPPPQTQTKMTFTFTYEELKMEVREFVLAEERKRLPRPIYRLSVILAWVRRYMALVNRANIPREHESQNELASKQRECLRLHREASRKPGAPLMALKDKLGSLNLDFVLDGAPDVWRLNDFDWESKMWKPLYGWIERGHALLFDIQPGRSWACIPASAMQEWQKQEQEIEWQLFARIAFFLPPDETLPVIDEDGRTIRWRGTDYPFGAAVEQFELVCLLIEARGKYVSHLAIGERLGKWDMKSGAIRAKVCRLKKILPADLSAAIKADRKGYLQMVCPIPQLDTSATEGQAKRTA